MSFATVPEAVEEIRAGRMIVVVDDEDRENEVGVGFVRGVPPHLYLERLDLHVLQKLGLSVEDSDRSADVYVRIPSNKESIFRAAVLHDGLPVSDVLQVWLDASGHPARGREQADEIRRRILGPLFGKQR